MDSSYLITKATQFRIYSTSEILQLSVKEITNPKSFDQLDNPVIGGLHDPEFGPSSWQDVCSSCCQSGKNCPGHFGHIKLPVVVFNPILMKQLVQLLQGTCFFCQRIMLPSHIIKMYIVVMKLLDKGFLTEAQDALEAFDKCSTTPQQIENEINLFEKKYDHIHPQSTVSSKHVETMVRNIVLTILHRMKLSSKKCNHCQEINRQLKMQQHSTIVGVQWKNFKLSRSNKIAEKLEIQDLISSGLKTEERDGVISSMVDDEVEMETDKDAGEAKEEDEGFGDMLPDLKDVESYTKSRGSRVVLSPFVAQVHLRLVWKKEMEFLKAVFPFLGQVSGLESGTDVFFIDVLPVVPTKFRPLSVLKGHKYENIQTTKLSKVLSQSAQLKLLLDDYATARQKEEQSTEREEATVPMEDGVKSLAMLSQAIYQACVSLQIAVNVLYDSTLDPFSNDVPNGVRQLLEKKEGLFRSNMMGKRVDFAARSVISPDPYIAVNQIGVPKVFASKLTYPQPVTPWNVHVLRQMVINGPDKYPGAFSIINENGYQVRLSPTDITQREAVANQLLVTDKANSDRKIVCRHLLNGDYVLMNRQPTLHRNSMQAHKVRVLKSIKTFRMHYSNCKAYNADFDGDEMNMHFPQDELSRAEAATLACTDYNYLVPKDGTPLGGLIQDHMVSGVTLSTRGRFFNKHDYCGLLWSAMNDSIDKLQLVPPSIIKPEPLWSGKQIISTIILNIIPKDQAPFNLNGSSKIPEKSWTCPDFVNDKQLTAINLKAWCSNEMGESTVVFRQGELLQGVLDKAHYGPTSYGLVHCCYELYGGVVAGKLLTYLGRLFANFLQMIGFSMGVGDILVLKHANKKRKSIIKKVRLSGNQAVCKALGKDTEMKKEEMLDGLKQAHFDKENLKMAEIDLCMKRETDQIQDNITKSIMPRGLEKRFPSNGLQLMVQSGAKGSPVNCMQISCLLGQIELEGRRPPLMPSGRSLPCFRPYDTSPQAGGFVTGRFLTGIRPPEYFFHCMAGREGLIDTAVKTSRSGYLQRCLVKHLEGIMVNYDLTVRDGDGSILQFYYGEDGIDGIKSSYLKPSQFPFFADNLPALPGRNDNSWLSPNFSKSVRKAWKRIKKWHALSEEEKAKLNKRVGFEAFCNQLLSDPDTVQQHKSTLVRHGKYNGRSEFTKQCCEALLELDEEKRTELLKKKRCPDPVMSKYLPHSQPNVLSEKFRQAVDQYCKNKLDKESTDQDEFKTVINKKIIQSLVPAGDAVGLLCAQSIGEPSTQMTLNTFHFAGRGEMNVTLGIPRLREILLTGSKMPKTPQVDVPIWNNPNALKQAERLKAELTTVTFNQVLEYVKVQVTTADHNFKRVNVTLKCLHHSQYREICLFKFKSIVEYVVKRFIPIVEMSVKKENRILSTSALLATGKLSRSANYSRDKEKELESPESITNDGGDDDDLIEIDPNDGDTAAMKEQQQQLDTNEYEGEDEERNQVDGDDDGDGLDEITDEVERQEEGNSDEEEAPQERQDMSEEFTNEEASVIIKKAMSHKSIVDAKLDDKEKRSITVTFEYPPSELQFDIKLMFERVIKSAVIQQVPGIKQAFISKEIEDGVTVFHLKTDGINIQYMFRYPEILDLNRLYTNSVYHMLQTYGIEAANRTVIKEIQNVFAAYGITVDYHHLSLLSDYMTNQGQYDSFNRAGMANQTSTFQKVTFETSMNFLMDACINANKDYLNSPSSQLVLGRPITIGTGCFDILLK